MVFTYRDAWCITVDTVPHFTHWPRPEGAHGLHPYAAAGPYPKP